MQGFMPRTPLGRAIPAELTSSAWADMLAKYGEKWLRLPIDSYRTGVDLVQLIAHEDCALEEVLSLQGGLVTEAHHAILRGLLRMVISMRLEREERLRHISIRLNIEMQHHMMSLADLSIPHRRYFNSFIVERPVLLLPYAGALGLTRVKVTAESLGLRFQVSNLLEDMYYGIDGWIYRDGSDPVPVQIKSISEQEKVGFEVVGPDSELDSSDRMRDAWDYLRGMQLPAKILLLRPNRREGGVVYEFDKSPGLAVVMVNGLLAFEGH